MNRAYSLIDIKSVNDDQWVIEGIASTPTPDRMGDIVEPMGAKFALPMPLLWQHDSEQPIGEVTFAKPTKTGIPFKARIQKPDGMASATLRERLTMAWESIKTGLVKAVSIGFRAIEYSWMDDGGLHFLAWEWLELSVVSVPAQADATINVIRSIDAEQWAASGRELPGADRPTPPATPAPAPRSGTAAIKAITPKSPQEGRTMKTIAEQIAAFEATRQAKAARMETLMTAAAEEGVTLDAEQSEEYDGLTAEVKAVDDHLVRLRALEQSNRAKAVAVDDTPTAEAGAASRALTPRVEVKGTNVPKGTAFTRYAVALARSKGNLMQAAEIAKAWHDTPEVEQVLRAAVAAGSTTDATWAGPLVQYQIMASEFIELLRPATVIGRIPGLRRVPFNIKMPRQTTGSTVGWVGQGKAKPVTKLGFDTVTLDFAKAAGIVVLTDELVRLSNPAAEELVRGDLIAAMAQFLDQQFLDPDISAVSNVSPASITNGVTAIHATGNTDDDLREDVLSLKAGFRSANLSSAGAVWIMSEQSADGIGMMVNSLSLPIYPGINANGGTFLGLPVITSQNDALIDGGSPTGNRIILVKPGEIMLADDGQVMLDSSSEASLQMSDAPDEPDSASTVHVSLWQRNLVGIRAERWINWQKRHSGCVQYISGANYGAD